MTERLSERERIITELKNVIGCTCDPAYKIRGLSAPDCAYCNYVDEVADWHLAEVKRIIDNKESVLTIHILRNWNREKIETFAKHLLGDNAQGGE